MGRYEFASGNVWLTTNSGELLNIRTLRSGASHTQTQEVVNCFFGFFMVWSTVFHELVLGKNRFRSGQIRGRGRVPFSDNQQPQHGSSII
jgi:hypothetical protein